MDGMRRIFRVGTVERLGIYFWGNHFWTGIVPQVSTEDLKSNFRQTGKRLGEVRMRLLPTVDGPFRRGLTWSLPTFDDD